MTPAQNWWYMHELQRKTRAAECDRERVERLLDRAHERDPAAVRLKNELEHIDHRLAKLKRGLLY